MILAELSCFYASNQVDRLLEEHWDEVAKNKALMVLKPDWARYEAIENAGKLLTVYALEGAQVVGYSCNLVDTHMHYMDLRICSNDVLFVHPSARGDVGLKLIRETERLAKQRGAQLMLWHAKKDSKLDKLLQRKAKRYGVQDIIYSTAL